MAPDIEVGDETAGRAGQHLITLSQSDLQRYFALATQQDGEEVEEDDEDPDYVPDEDDDEDDNPYFPRAGTPGHWYEEVTEPQAEGIALLNSGEFGRLGHQIKTRAKDNNIARTLLRRGASVRPVPREDIASVSADSKPRYYSIVTWHITGNTPKF